MILTGGLTGAAFAEEMTGLISDAAGSWNHARAAKKAKECALGCVEAGWAPVFVPDGQIDAFKDSDKSMAGSWVMDKRAEIERHMKGQARALAKRPPSLKKFPSQPR